MLFLSQRGADTVAEATASPVGATSATALGAGTARGGDKTVNVQVDKVEVATQATDAQGISQDIGRTLGNEMRSAADLFDDGVLA